MKLPSTKTSIKFIISVSILVLLLLTQLDFTILAQEARSSNIWLMVISLMLIICQIFFLNLRWHELLNGSKQSVPFKISSLINIMGYIANITFITSIGGIVTKSGLAIQQGLSVTHSIFITFLDRFMTMLALIIFSAIGLIFLHGVLSDNLVTALSLFISGILMVIILFFAILLRFDLFNKIISRTQINKDIILLLNNYTENSDLIIKTCLYSLIAQSCFFYSVYILSLGIETEINIISFFALLPILALISSLPISFGGWGVREGAFIYGLSLIGFTPEGAFLLSIKVGFVTLIAPFLVGLPYLLQSDLRDIVLRKNKAKQI